MRNQPLLFTIYLLRLILFTNGDLLDNLESKVVDIKRRHLTHYGNKTKTLYKLWELDNDMDDRLGYPGHDKHKLAQLSSDWSHYYACTLREARSLVRGSRGARALAVFEGAIALLPCGLCIAPGEKVAWEYAQTLQNLTFEPLCVSERSFVQSNGSLQLQSSVADAGVYRCHVGDSTGSLLVLEVFVHEDYDVVKSQLTRGPYPAPPSPILDQLTAFTRWSEWSECSQCGRVGRRRRYGICTVKLSAQLNVDLESPQRLNGTRNLTELFQVLHDLSEAPCIVREIMRTTASKLDQELHHKKIKTHHFFGRAVFPEGLPCRSRYLPEQIKNITTIQNRRSEIMIGLCKVKCATDVLFEVRSSDGRVLERVNNSAGEYSLKQTRPRPPPAPVYDIVFANVGETVTVKCPGIVLVDRPVSWRVGTKDANARALRAWSQDRVYINARDHLVISSVDYTDGNLYSCWHTDALLGAVKVSVSGDASANVKQRAILLFALVLSAAAAKWTYYLYSRSNS